MAAPPFLYTLQVGGRLFNAEGWTCSLHVASDTAVTADMTALTAATVAWHTSSGAHHALDAHLEFVKFNRIVPATGKFFEQGFTNVVFPADTVGQNDGAPGQLTLAVSTRTVLIRGRAHAGRFYPPNCSSAVTAVDPDGLVTDVTCDDVATAAKLWLDGVNAAVAPGHVVVWSSVGQIAQQVTKLRVGHVVDTQRRRRRSLPETYRPEVVLA